MNNFFEEVRKYLEETPQEKVLEDWAKSAHLDDVGPSVEDFLRHSQYYHIFSSQPDDGCQNKIINDFSPEFSSGFFYIP